jgi:hypothetical protein
MPGERMRHRGEYDKTHGRMMPDNGRDLIRQHDAIDITLWARRRAVCQRGSRRAPHP